MALDAGRRPWPVAHQPIRRLARLVDQPGLYRHSTGTGELRQIQVLQYRAGLQRRRLPKLQQMTRRTAQHPFDDDRTPRRDKCRHARALARVARNPAALDHHYLRAAGQSKRHQHIQAGTPLMRLQSSLGLEFDQDRNEILLREPRLPAFLEEVTLRNLRLGQSVVDLMLRRHGNDVSIQVLRNEGQIRIAAVY